MTYSKNCLIFFIILFSSVSAKANRPILFRAKDTNPKEFSAYTETTPVKSYAQFLLEKKRKSARPIELKKVLKQAQLDFLSHEPNLSKKSFHAITENIHSFDWTKPERKIIFYALLRLAQMEKNLKKKKILLKEAFVFGMNLKLDMKVFPPPLTKLYAKIKKTANIISIDLNKLFPQHEFVLINGTLYSNTQKISLPYGTYRVTLLSSSHQSHTQTLSLSSLITKKWKSQALIAGSCKKPVIYLQEKPSLTRILFPNFCVWSSSPSALKPQHYVAQKDEDTEDEQEDMLPADISMVEELKKPEKEDSEWEEWVWIGAAVVVGVVAVILLASGGEDEETEEQAKTPPLPPPASPPKNPPPKRHEPIITVGF